MEQDKTTVDDLSDSLRVVKEEIRALKDAAGSKKPQWYRNIPTWISIFALLLSFSTAYFSQRRAKAQDLQNKRVELRGLLQQLSALSKEYLEAPRKYQGDPIAIGYVQSGIAQDSSLISRQAAELARTLPRSQVSSAEWLLIGMSLERDLNHDLTKEFMGYAVESAKTFTDKSAALAGNARVLFVMGQPEEGRKEYQKILNIFSEFKEYDDDTKNRTYINTYVSWAYSEAYKGLKEQANQCLTKAESHLSQLRPGRDIEAIRMDIAEARKQINFGEAGSIPPLTVSDSTGANQSSRPKTDAGGKATPTSASQTGQQK